VRPGEGRPVRLQSSTEFPPCQNREKLIKVCVLPMVFSLEAFLESIMHFRRNVQERDAKFNVNSLFLKIIY
jgi:hypothetical protein